VYYKNLYRWEKAFVSASLVFKDTDECAEGAKATVELDGALAGEALSNNFGDVIVDGLDPGREYAVRIEAPGYAPHSTSVRLDQSLNLGTVLLKRA
jgi:hypothetical protein